MRESEAAGALFGLKALNVIIKDTLPSLYASAVREKQLEFIQTLVNKIMAVVLSKEHLLNLKLYDLEKLLSNLSNRFIEGKEYALAIETLEFIMCRSNARIAFKSKNVQEFKLQNSDNTARNLKKIDDILSNAVGKVKSIEKISLVVTVWTNTIRILINITQNLDYIVS